MIEEQIRVLTNFRFNELDKKSDSFSRQWIKDKLCPCVKFVREEYTTINCKHYKKAFTEKFKKEIKEIKKISNIMFVQRLLDRPELLKQLQGEKDISNGVKE